MEVAGKVKTLPMYLYEQVMSNFKYGRAALVGFVLLLPAVISFVLDLFLKEDNGEENKTALISSGRVFNFVSILVIILLVFFLFIPNIFPEKQGSFSPLWERKITLFFVSL